MSIKFINANTSRAFFPNPYSPIQKLNSVSFHSFSRTFNNSSYINSSRSFTTLTHGEKENQLNVSRTLYDKIQQIFSYSPSGVLPTLDKNTSFFQIIPNGIPISLKEYQKNSPCSPLNPQGDLRTTEEFSDYASIIFDLNGFKSTKKLEDIYSTILNGANTSKPFDEKAKEVLEKVQNYLKAQTKDPFTGEKVFTDSPAYVKYKKALTDYRVAISKYIATKNSIDLTTIEGQKEWQLRSILLQNKIDQTYDDLVASDANVTRALRYMQSYGNNAVEYVITQSKQLLDQTALTSQITARKFHPSYGIPSNWYENAGDFTQITFDSSKVSSNLSDESLAYGGSASYSSGLFSINGSFERSEHEKRKASNSSQIKIAFKIGTIAIERPWLNSTIFALKGWNLNPKTLISNGKFPKNSKDFNDALLPFYSSSFVVAKEVEISGHLSKSDESMLDQATKAEASIGYGPFKLSGHYASSSHKENFSAKKENGTYKIPGAQLIGVINAVIPESPPNA